MKQCVNSKSQNSRGPTLALASTWAVFWSRNAATSQWPALDAMWRGVSTFWGQHNGSGTLSSTGLYEEQKGSGTLSSTGLYEEHKGLVKLSPTGLYEEHKGSGTLSSTGLYEEHKGSVKLSHK